MNQVGDFRQSRGTYRFCFLFGHDRFPPLIAQNQLGYFVKDLIQADDTDYRPLIQNRQQGQVLFHHDIDGLDDGVTGLGGFFLPVS